MKPDLTRIAKVRISVLLPDGKRWDIVPVGEDDITDAVNIVPVGEDDITAAVMLVSSIMERAKIDGPYSAGKDIVEIAGVPE